MPEICLYEPWTMKTAMPEEIESLLKTNGKKRISYEENDCSRYNTRTQGKSARLHPPTCSAMLKLYEIENNRENGAAGIPEGKKPGELYTVSGIPIGGFPLRTGLQLQKWKISGNSEERKRSWKVTICPSRTIYRGGISGTFCVCEQYYRQSFI